MNRRQELLDLEAQTSDHNRAMRAEHNAAAPDPLEFRWVNGIAYEPETIPDAADLAEMERWRR